MINEQILESNSKQNLKAILSQLLRTQTYPIENLLKILNTLEIKLKPIIIYNQNQHRNKILINLSLQMKNN